MDERDIREKDGSLLGGKQVGSNSSGEQGGNNFRSENMICQLKSKEIT